MLYVTHWILAVWISFAAYTTSCDPLAWELVSAGDLAAGLNDAMFPIKRYGASLLAFSREGEDTALVLTRGYLFDHMHRQPMWLDDVWQRTTAESSPWQQIALDKSPAERYKSASACGISKKDGSQRCYLFGGGGAGSASAVYSDLIVVDATSRRVATVSSSKEAPSPRQGASMVVVSTEDMHPVLLLYGGVNSRGAYDAQLYQGKLSYSDGDDSASIAWSGVSVDRGRAGETPPMPRRAAIFLHMNQGSDGHTEMLLFGGYSENPRNFNDVWKASVTLSAVGGPTETIVRWSCLHDGTMSSTSLAPTPGGAAVGAVYKSFLYITQGSECDWKCSNLGSDIWRFDVTYKTWTRLFVDGWNAPVPRHEAAFVLAPPSTLYMFGGESFHPHAYWNDLWKIELDETIITEQQQQNFSDVWFTEANTRHTESLMIQIRDAGPKPQQRPDLLVRVYQCDPIALVAVITFGLFIGWLRLSDRRGMNGRLPSTRLSSKRW